MQSPFDDDDDDDDDDNNNNNNNNNNNGLPFWKPLIFGVTIEQAN